jgi:hypothetical protein
MSHLFIAKEKKYYNQHVFIAFTHIATFFSTYVTPSITKKLIFGMYYLYQTF